jgi:hypothetical protein
MSDINPFSIITIIRKNGYKFWIWKSYFFSNKPKTKKGLSSSVLAGKSSIKTPHFSKTKALDWARKRE